MLGNDLIVLLLDVPLVAESIADCRQQQLQASFTAPGNLLEQVLYFVGAYLMMNDTNQLAVFGLTHDSCTLLHASLGDDSPAASHFSNPTKNMKDKLLDMLGVYANMKARQEEAGVPVPKGIALSAGLSRALCLIHRLQGPNAASWQIPSDNGNAGDAGNGGSGLGRHCKPRILCVTSSPDVPAQYIQIMNAIFSAQRADVSIDTLMLSKSNSTYLQQAAHLTNGLYLQPFSSSTASAASSTGGWTQQHNGAQHAGTSAAHVRSALQYLLSCMTADRQTRVMLKVDQPLGVDLRAACFCHKTPVDVGKVCSVCLSIFCQDMQECQTCGSVFKR